MSKERTQKSYEDEIAWYDATLKKAMIALTTGKLEVDLQDHHVIIPLRNINYADVHNDYISICYAGEVFDLWRLDDKISFDVLNNYLKSVHIFF